MASLGVLAACSGAPSSSAVVSRACLQAGGGPKVRSVLIGVSDYSYDDHLTGGGWDNVHSHHDLALLQAALTEFGVEAVCTLRDSEATAHGIQALLERVAATTAPGDHLFIHYSGHARQVADVDGDEADGLDEALAPYGASRAHADGTGLLLDDTVAELFEDIRLAAGPSGSLAVSLDACHSATATRSRPTAGTRGAPSTSRSLEPTGIWDAPLGVSDRAPMVAFFAAGADQQAGETDTPIGPAGRLSAALAHALATPRSRPTWGAVAAEVAHRMAYMSITQKPVFVGDGELGIFGSAPSPHIHHDVEQVISARELDLGVGALHGLSVGDAVVPEAGGIPRGVVTTVGPARARVQLVADAPLNRVAATRFRVDATGNDGWHPHLWTDPDLAVRVELVALDGGCQPMGTTVHERAVGQRYGVRLAATGTRPVWTTLVVEDSDGTRQAVWPTEEMNADWLLPGVDAWHPPVCLEAQPPLGTDRVTVVATDRPLSRAGLLGGTQRGAAVHAFHAYAETVELKVLPQPAITTTGD